LQALALAADAGRLAVPFWQEALLNAISPVVAAVLGGLVVTLIIQRVQNAGPTSGSAKTASVRNYSSRRRSSAPSGTAGPGSAWT
jgi:hypothetical protein